MLKEFVIDQVNWDELIRLSKIAHETPVFALSCEQGISGQDFASLAREDVFRHWRKVGMQYGFDPDTVRAGRIDERTIEAEPT